MSKFILSQEADNKLNDNFDSSNNKSRRLGFKFRQAIDLYSRYSGKLNLSWRVHDLPKPAQLNFCIVLLRVSWVNHIHHSMDFNL